MEMGASNRGGGGHGPVAGAEEPVGAAEVRAIDLTVEVRELAAGDVDAAVALWRESRVPYPLTAPALSRALRRSDDPPEGWIAWARRGGRDVGVILAQPGWRMLTAHVALFLVHPAHRRQGVGRALWVGMTEHLAGSSHRRLGVGRRWPALLPGPPLQSGNLRRFLAGVGYRELAVVHDLGRSLEGFTPSDRARALSERCVRLRPDESLRAEGLCRNIFRDAQMQVDVRTIFHTPGAILLGYRDGDRVMAFAGLHPPRGGVSMAAPFAPPGVWGVHPWIVDRSWSAQGFALTFLEVAILTAQREGAVGIEAPGCHLPSAWEAFGLQPLRSYAVLNSLPPVANRFGRLYADHRATERRMRAWRYGARPNPG